MEVASNRTKVQATAARWHSRSEGIPIVFEESIETTVPTARPDKQRSSKRWLIAVFFLLLNLVIFAVAGRFLFNGGRANRSKADLDLSPPVRQNPSPPADNLGVAPNSSVFDGPTSDPTEAHSEPTPSNDPQYVQAKNKLRSAWHWMEDKNPELAKKFARQAIELAPDSDVAKEAQTILDSLE